MSHAQTRSARRQRFEQLFDAHYSAVSGYAHRRAAPGDAEDAVGETFLVAWRRIDDVPREAKPWLLGVARRVLANQRRAGARRAALTERVTREPTGRDELERSPTLAALRRLSDGDREVLLLAAWDGLTTAEAAAVLGCSPTAAKVRLHRARRRLRGALEELQAAAPVPAAATAVTPRLEECHDE